MSDRVRLKVIVSDPWEWTTSFFATVDRNEILSAAFPEDTVVAQPEDGVALDGKELGSMRLKARSYEVMLSQVLDRQVVGTTVIATTVRMGPPLHALAT